MMRGWLGRLCVCCFFFTACSLARAHACLLSCVFCCACGPHHHVSICALRRVSYATAFDPCARSLPRGLNLSMETELERCSAVRGQFFCKFTQTACITMAHDCACSSGLALCHCEHPLTALHTSTYCSTPSCHPLLRYITVAHHRCSHTYVIRFTLLHVTSTIALHGWPCRPHPATCGRGMGQGLIHHILTLHPAQFCD